MSRLTLITALLSLVPPSFTVAASPPKSEVVAQVSRFFEGGGSEEFFLYCPSGAGKLSVCEVAKVSNDVETKKGTMKYPRAFAVLEQFLSQMPKSDIVGGEEPPAITKSAETAMLWQVRIGKRWSKGTFSKGELQKLSPSNTKRMQAIHGLQWRLMDVLKTTTD